MEIWLICVVSVLSMTTMVSSVTLVYVFYRRRYHTLCDQANEQSEGSKSQLCVSCCQQVKVPHTCEAYLAESDFILSQEKVEYQTLTPLCKVDNPKPNFLTERIQSTVSSSGNSKDSSILVKWFPSYDEDSPYELDNQLKEIIGEEDDLSEHIEKKSILNSYQQRKVLQTGLGYAPSKVPTVPREIGYQTPEMTDHIYYSSPTHAQSSVRLEGGDAGHWSKRKWSGEERQDSFSARSYKPFGIRKPFNSEEDINHATKMPAVVQDGRGHKQPSSSCQRDQHLCTEQETSKYFGNMARSRMSVSTSASPSFQQHMWSKNIAYSNQQISTDRAQGIPYVNTAANFNTHGSLTSLEGGEAHQPIIQRLDKYRGRRRLQKRLINSISKP